MGKCDEGDGRDADPVVPFAHGSTTAVVVVDAFENREGMLVTDVRTDDRQCAGLGEAADRAHLGDGHDPKASRSSSGLLSCSRSKARSPDRPVALYCPGVHRGFSPGGTRDFASFAGSDTLAEHTGPGGGMADALA